MIVGIKVRVHSSLAFEGEIGEVVEIDESEELQVRVSFKGMRDTYWFRYKELEEI
jgi:transcription antitermination factor NusG